jgi:methyl-accepting chemotaxis protein
VIHTIRGRQAVAFGIFLLGLLGGGILGIRTLRGLSGEFDAGMSRAGQTAELGARLQRDVLQLIFAADRYITSGDIEAKRQFAELAGSVQELARRYAQIEGVSAADVRLVEELNASLTRLEVDYARAHAAFDGGRAAEARALAAAAHPLAETVARQISELGELQASYIMGTSRVLRERARDRANYLLAITIVALALGAALAALTVRSIDRPLAQLVGAAERLGEGQLRTEVSGADMPREFAALAYAFDTMAGHLRELASKVASSASQLSASASEFSAISEQVAASTNEVAVAIAEISQGADRQANALIATAQTVAELRAGAVNLESEASQNRDLSHHIRQEADQSQVSVKGALDLLRALRGVVHRTGDEIGGLESASEKIAGFVRRISAIAEQTHLLSLNAAIEAAHAGHEGRGFSVVAEEVRKLAAEADTAAREVEEVVAQIRERIAGTVSQMRDGESQVVQVEGVAHSAESALDAIASGIARVSEASDKTLATSRRSRTLLDRVASHVESITQTSTAHAARSQDVSAAVQQQTATTQEISASVTQLVAVANDLRRLIGLWQT